MAMTRRLRAASYYVGTTLTLVGAVPQLYVLFTSRTLTHDEFALTYYPGTAAALVGLALYATSLKRSTAWVMLGILNPFGPLFAIFWLHPAVKDPRLRLVLPLLFAYASATISAFSVVNLHVSVLVTSRHWRFSESCWA